MLVGGTVSVIVAGEIDMVTAGRLTDVLWKAMAGRSNAEILVDFAGVTFCDAIGVQALVDAHTHARACGMRLRLVNVQPPVRRVLEITGLYGTLTGS